MPACFHPSIIPYGGYCSVGSSEGMAGRQFALPQLLLFRFCVGSVASFLANVLGDLKSAGGAGDGEQRSGFGAKSRISPASVGVCREFNRFIAPLERVRLFWAVAR